MKILLEKFLLFISITVVSILVVSCNANKAPKSLTRVAALKGPTAMGMVKLMEESDATGEGSTLNFEILNTADEVVVKIAKEEVDIAAIPVNLASILYNKPEINIKMVAVNTLGVLYILDTTGTINSVEDLKGKTIYTVGKGTTPEYTLKYVLNQNGLIDDADVNIEFKVEATELAALLSSGQGEIVMLPEPFVSTVLAQNPEAKIALNLTEEWDKVQSEFSLITGSVIVRTKFLEQNPEAVNEFLKQYNASIHYVNSNIEEASALVEKYGIVPKAAIAKQAIPRCNIVYMVGEEMKKTVEGYLNILFEADAKSIGGKLPNEDFYFTK